MEPPAALLQLKSFISGDNVNGNLSQYFANCGGHLSLCVRFHVFHFCSVTLANLGERTWLEVAPQGLSFGFYGTKI